jgi:virulence-associated protein VapD
MIYGIVNTFKGPIYKRIRVRLEQVGFERIQGSLYHRNHTNAVNTWIRMLGLRTILPLGVIPSCLKGIEMFFISHPDVMVTTENMQLGGLFSPNLIGPTPINLVPNGVPSAALLQPPIPLPVNVRNDPAAQLGANWATHV